MNYFLEFMKQIQNIQNPDLPLNFDYFRILVTKIPEPKVYGLIIYEL
jgi:hypothetical protein